MERIDGDLWAAVRLLSTRQQRVVYSLYWGGWTEDEIAIAHNKSRDSIHRCLESARKEIEKYFSLTAQFGVSQTLLVMKAKSGKVDRGNGQLSTDQKRPVSIDRPAPSQNPAPDIYYESPERDDFLNELESCCASAIMQVGSDGGVNLCYAEYTAARRDLLNKARRDESKPVAKRAA